MQNKGCARKTDLRLTTYLQLRASRSKEKPVSLLTDELGNGLSLRGHSKP